MYLSRPAGRIWKSPSLVELLWVAAIVIAPFDAVLLLPYKVIGMHLSVPRITMLMAVAVSFFKGLCKGQVRIRTHNLSLVLFSCWLGWNFISGLWAYSQAGYVRYIALLALNGMLFLSILHIATSAHKFHIIFKGIYWVILVSLLFGFIEIAFGYRVPASRQWTFRYEITSLFINPSHFGGALAMFAPFVLVYPLWLPRVKPGAMLGSLVLLGLIVYFVIRSGSRGALLALIVGCAVTFVLSVIQHRLTRTMRGLAIVLASFVLLAVSREIASPIPEAISNKLATLRTPTETAWENPRLALWKTGLEFWKESPITGWGAGASEFLLMDRTPWLLVYSLHMWDIEVLTNTGIIGSMLWMFLTIIIVMGLLKCLRCGQEPYVRFMASNLLGSLASSAIISITVASLMTFPLFWIFLGLSAALASGLHFGSLNTHNRSRMPLEE